MIGTQTLEEWNEDVFDREDPVLDVAEVKVVFHPGDTDPLAMDPFNEIVDLLKPDGARLHGSGGDKETGRNRKLLQQWQEIGTKVTIPVIDRDEANVAVDWFARREEFQKFADVHQVEVSPKVEELFPELRDGRMAKHATPIIGWGLVTQRPVEVERRRTSDGRPAPDGIDARRVGGTFDGSFNPR